MPNWWSHPGQRLALLRQLHTYVGAFIAPTVLFFAITGGMQLFRLHEAHGAYAPPAVIEALGRLHKDQVFGPGHKKAKPAEAAKAASEHADHDEDHDADHGSAAGHDHDADHVAPAAAAHDHDVDHDHGEKHGPTLSTTLLRWLFLGVATGLVLSTCLGLWMGIAHSRNKATVWVLLVLGAIVPVALLFV